MYYQTQKTQIINIAPYVPLSNVPPAQHADKLIITNPTALTPGIVISI